MLTPEDALHEKCREIYQRCEKEGDKVPYWSSFYHRRYVEFVGYLKLMPKTKFNNVLELGCGVGFHSAMLSQLSKKVVATDIQEVDPNTHSVGLEKTGTLLKSLDVNNVQVEAITGETLPYADNSFDMVYSSYVLEHVPNREKGISEIKRVCDRQPSRTMGAVGAAA